MTERCLFCESDKEGRRIDSEKDFVCGSCVSKFLGLDGDKLEELYETCCNTKKIRKASAIAIFMSGKPTKHLEIAEPEE